MSQGRHYVLQAESEVRLRYGDRLGMIQTWEEGGRQRVLAATGLSGVVTMYLGTGLALTGSYIVTGCSLGGQGRFVCNLVPVDTVEASTERNEAETRRILSLPGNRT